MFIFIIWYSFDIAILVVTIFTLAGILFQKYTRKTISAFSSTISDYSTSANFLIKFINSNYRTLRVSPEILLTINELNNYWKKLSQARQKQLQIQSLPKIYFEIIFSASALAIILFEYTRYGNFELALVSKLITYLFIASRLLPALIRLNSALTGIKSSHVEINKLGHFYQSQQVPTYKVDYDRNVFEEVDAIDISLNNVSFKYDNREIFKNLNFEFKFGSHTLIFGDSGSGKSTLIDLLLGLRQVNEGKIEINGANPFEFINNFPGVISYVGPNYYFGKTTFKTFLKNSKLLNDGSSGQIEKVLKLVNLYTEINDNRDSLETVIEQESGNFSNGQKQRLAIARSLLHNPKVLILDESLNALDEKSQLLLLRGIIDWQINKTLIVVSHNLEFKKLFRNILFL
jgi:ABC-type bacteriocin/lantibiotic exporter with double-glycine peptidase domain